MTVTGDGGKAIEQSTFVRRDAEDYDETGGRVDWIRATFAVGKRPQVTGGAPRVCVRYRRRCRFVRRGRWPT